jgi:sortase A
VGVLGEILITLGLVMLLMVAYQLWWTNVQADRATASAAQTLSTSWEKQAAPKPVEQRQPKVGEAFAKMYIPRLKDKVWGIPVLQGVGAEQLSQGVGHYIDTAMPGEIGNFATAAHRATNGEPFRNIDLIEKGDRVYVETQHNWFVYRLEKDRIVSPEDVWVIDPVPGEPDETPTRALITLTTCHPRWASYERWIWWGTLEESIDKKTGTTPKPIEAAN